MEYLYTPRYCYISPLCFTAQRRLQVHDLPDGSNEVVLEVLGCRQHASLLRMKTAAAGAWRREAGETHLCYDGHVRPDDP
jgi:hypothetical protein